jgi:hypothetical protein
MENDIDGIGQTRSSTCKLIAKCLMNLQGDANEIMIWLLRAVSEAPTLREPWINLAQGWLTVGDYYSAYSAIQRGLALTDKLRTIEVEEWCWDNRVLQLKNTLAKLININV